MRNIRHSIRKIGQMPPAPRSPLLTSKEIGLMFSSRDARAVTLECSLDLQLSTSTIGIGPIDWAWDGRRYPYPERFKERTVYYWADAERAFQPAAQFSSSLIKLVPTEWGAPTFEIDGIKMLPSAKISPFEDAQTKVALIQPKDKTNRVLRGECRRALAEEHQSLVPGYRTAPEADSRGCHPRGDHPRRRFSRCDPARSTPIRHCRGTLFAELLSATRTRPQAPRTPLSLHGHPQQDDQRTRRAERSGQKIALCRLRDGENRRWNTRREEIMAPLECEPLNARRPAQRPAFII